MYENLLLPKETLEKAWDLFDSHQRSDLVEEILKRIPGDEEKRLQGLVRQITQNHPTAWRAKYHWVIVLLANAAYRKKSAALGSMLQKPVTLAEVGGITREAIVEVAQEIHRHGSIRSILINPY